MKKIYIAFLILIISLSTFAADRYWDNTKTIGNWSTGSNWVGGVAPINTDNVFFTNSTGVTVSIDGTFSPTAIIVDGGNPIFTASAARTLSAASGFTIKNNATLTVTGSAAITFTAQGGTSLVELGSTLLFTGTGTGGSRLNCLGGTTVINGMLRYNVLSGNTSGVVGISFGPSAIYQVDKNGGSVMAGTYASTSLILLTGSTSSAPSFGVGTNTVFGNIEMNCPTLGSIINLGFSSGNSMSGTFKLSNVNNNIIRFGTNPTANPLTIGGDIIINNGTLQLSNGTTATTFNVAGKVQLATGTTLDLQGTSGNNVLNIKGDLTSLGTVTESGTSPGCTISLTGASTQNISIANPITNDVSLQVNGAGAIALTDINLSSSTNAKLTFTAGNIDMKTNSKILTVQNPQSNAIIGGTAASHIIGRMRRNSNAATGYSFPVSDNATDLKKAVVSTSSAVATTWEVEFLNTNPNSSSVPILTNGDQIDNVSPYIWDIKRIVGSSDASNVTLSYSFTGNGVLTPANAKIVHWAGTAWESFGGIDAVGSIDNTKGTDGIAMSNITNFSPFTFGGALSVLPVSFEYFKGYKLASINTLDWKVSCTSASSVQLTLERSANGNNFKAINEQTVPIARCLQGFSYSDVSPLAGANYYRLKITSPDGQFRYSTIVVLLNKEKGFELISVAPNPVQDKAILTLTSAKAGKVEITVSDVAGKIVAKQVATVIAGNNPIPLNFATLGAGTYTISAQNADGEIKNTRFVKF